MSAHGDEDRRDRLLPSAVSSCLKVGSPDLGQLGPRRDGVGGMPALHLVDPRNLGSQFLGRVRRVPGSGKMGSRAGRRIRWAPGGSWDRQGYLAGIRKILGLIRDQLSIRRKAGGSWNERWGGGLWRGKSQGEIPGSPGGSTRDSVRPKHLGNHAGSGGSGVARVPAHRYHAGRVPT